MALILAFILGWPLVLVGLGLLLASFFAFATDSEGWALTWFIGAVAAVLFFSSGHPETLSVWSWVSDLSWKSIAVYTGLYLLAGVGVSMVKWYLDRRADAERARVTYKEAFEAYQADDSLFNGLLGEKRYADGVQLTEELMNRLKEESAKTGGNDRNFFQKIYARAQTLRSNLRAMGGGGTFGIGFFDQLTDTTAFTKSIAKKMSDKVDTIVYWMIEWPVTLFCMLFENLVIEIGREIVKQLRGVYDALSTYAYKDVEVKS